MPRRSHARRRNVNARAGAAVKAPACPVCRRQLERLRAELPRLRSCGATFLVVGPGPAAALRTLAEATGFPYPSVEDTGLALARAAGLVLGPGEIVPAVLVAAEARRVVWTDPGRAPGAFNDAALLARLGCPPDRLARSGP
jgi:hypothetical protein